MIDPALEDRQTCVTDGIPGRLILSAVTAGLAVLMLLLPPLGYAASGFLPNDPGIVTTSLLVIDALSSGFVASMLLLSSWWSLVVIAALVSVLMYVSLRRSGSVGNDSEVTVPVLVAWHLLWLGYLLDEMILHRGLEVADCFPDALPEALAYEDITAGGIPLHFGSLVIVLIAMAIGSRCRSRTVRWAILSLLAMWSVTVAFPV